MKSHILPSSFYLIANYIKNVSPKRDKLVTLPKSEQQMVLSTSSFENPFCIAQYYLIFIKTAGAAARRTRAPLLRSDVRYLVLSR